MAITTKKKAPVIVPKPHRPEFGTMSKAQKMEVERREKEIQKRLDIERLKIEAEVLGNEAKAVASVASEDNAEVKKPGRPKKVE